MQFFCNAYSTRLENDVGYETKRNSYVIIAGKLLEQAHILKLHLNDIIGWGAMVKANDIETKMHPGSGNIHGPLNDVSYLMITRNRS